VLCQACTTTLRSNFSRVIFGKSSRNSRRCDKCFRVQDLHFIYVCCKLLPAARFSIILHLLVLCSHLIPFHTSYSTSFSLPFHPTFSLSSSSLPYLPTPHSPPSPPSSLPDLALVCNFTSPNRSIKYGSQSPFLCRRRSQIPMLYDFASRTEGVVRCVSKLW